MVLMFVSAVLLGRFRLNSSLRTLLKFTATFSLALENLVSAVLTIALDGDDTNFVDLGDRDRRAARRDAAGVGGAAT